MTINQLDYFLTLARTLNYTKASKLLHLTQPHLSKTIVALEQEIGVRLFVRNKRDVRMTPAGEVFYQETAPLFQSYNEAVTKTKEAYEGFYGMLNVGFLGTAMIHLMPKIVNRFKLDFPNISLNLLDYTYSTLQEALLEDRLDVAILPDRELNNVRGLEKKYMIADDMCVAVNQKHPFADREFVELYDFKDEGFIIMDPKVSVRDHNLVTSICLEQDFLPRIVHESNTLSNLLMMVECGIGVSILAKHMSHFATENVKFIRILGYENYFKLVCAWHKDKNPCVEQFVAVVEACCSSLRYHASN
ncbi:MAG: LysR family transcriptional regulator [Clostridiales Family XIII bacterium]|jgi:DNA-binding transcriptional LysR family regulator|nr:LysR family transcriptional regulator [Clostridiales Family XIII bacterium]